MQTFTIFFPSLYSLFFCKSINTNNPAILLGGLFERKILFFFSFIVFVTELSADVAVVVVDSYSTFFKATNI
jgi:hypothetical protein